MLRKYVEIHMFLYNEKKKQRKRNMKKIPKINTFS